MRPASPPRAIVRRAAVMLAAAALVAISASPATAATASGERIFGQVSVEPVYNDMTGQIAFVATPIKAPNPAKANPVAWAPIYLPVYPKGSTVDATLNCVGVPGNCPDHDGPVAGLAALFMSSVYGNGVIGHDHLLAPQASGGDFNIAWEPVLVLFTHTHDTYEHITTLAQINRLVASGDARLFPLPPATFLCAVVPAGLYWKGTAVPTS
jgi:hypothetical protein